FLAGVEFTRSSLVSGGAISGNARSSMWTGRPVRCVEWSLRTGGMISLRGRKPEGCLRCPGTTTRDRENRERGAGNILRHAEEPKQLLCAVYALHLERANSPCGADSSAPSTTIRRNRCCRFQRRVTGREEIP